MTTTSLQSWFQSLPSWVLPARPFSDTEGDPKNRDSRVSSMASASTEGIIGHDGGFFGGRWYFGDDEKIGGIDGDEDGDPWTDPWRGRRGREISVEAGERRKRWSGSSRYSDAPVVQELGHELRQMSPAPMPPYAKPPAFGRHLQLEHENSMAPSTVDSFKTAATSKSSDCPTVIGSSAPTSLTGSSLGAKVKEAFHSHSEYDDDVSSQSSLPTRPARVYRIPTEKVFFSPSDSGSAKPPSWLQSKQSEDVAEESEYEKVQSNWRSASRARDAVLRGGGDGGSENADVEESLKLGIDDKKCRSKPPTGASPRMEKITKPLPAYASFESIPTEKSLPSLPGGGKRNSSLSSSTSNKGAWLQAVLCGLVAFNCWGLALSFGLFQDYYARRYLSTSSTSSISWIGSTQIALIFGLGVPAGRLVERGDFRILLNVGSLFLVMGTLGSSWCERLVELWVVQGLVTGLGMGTAFGSAMAALHSWFDERKLAVAIGFVGVGGCLGGIVYVLIARKLLVDNGFDMTMRVPMGVMLATMIPPLLLLRVRRTTPHQQAGSRLSIGSPERRTYRQQVISFKDAAYLMSAGVMFLTFLGLYSGFFYIISYTSTTLGLQQTASNDLLIFMGHLILALIRKRQFGPLKSIVPLVLLSSAAVWLWAAGGNSRATLTVVACLPGFLVASVYVLVEPTVHQLCWEPASKLERSLYRAGYRDAELVVEKYGVKAGGIFGVITLACLVGPHIAGALVSDRRDRDLAHPFLGAQAFVGATLLVGGCLLLGSRIASGRSDDRR